MMMIMINHAPESTVDFSFSDFWVHRISDFTKHSFRYPPQGKFAPLCYSLTDRSTILF